MQNRKCKGREKKKMGLWNSPYKAQSVDDVSVSLVALSRHSKRRPQFFSSRRPPSPPARRTSCYSGRAEFLPGGHALLPLPYSASLLCRSSRSTPSLLPVARGRIGIRFSLNP